MGKTYHSEKEIIIEEIKIGVEEEKKIRVWKIVEEILEVYEDTTK